MSTEVEQVLRDVAWTHPDSSREDLAKMQVAALRAANLLREPGVPDVATEETFKKAEAFDKAVALSERRQTLLEEAEAERDAALAAIERVREIHEQHPVVSTGFPALTTDVVYCANDCEYPCKTIAVLDGAPEPEWEWEYGAKVYNSGRVVRIEDSPEKVRLGRSAISYANPQWVDDVLVRRRKAGPWELVESEGEEA